MCFTCATSTPERNQAAQDTFGVQLAAAAAMSPLGSVVLTESGVEPLLSDDLEEPGGQEHSPAVGGA